MNKKTFQKFREIVYDNSGITLNDSKEAMVSSRIEKRMRTLGIDDHTHYLQLLLEDETGDEITLFLDAISTNVTSFFREHEHFEFLGELVSEWVKNGKHKIRIWSAASSSGEEPYSIAMTLLVAADVQKIDMRILGTDISTRVLEKAKAGAYSAAAMENIPDNLKKKFFSVKKEGSENIYVSRDILKKLI
ncbi:MAG: CheR family methyltransferase, partial [Pseudomonadota bacterium]